MKDVLQHWPNADIIAFLPSLRRFRYCLITNDCAIVGRTVNADIAPGEWRGIDLSQPPFSVKGTWLGRMTSEYGDKRVFLVQNPPPARPRSR